MQTYILLGKLPKFLIALSLPLLFVTGCAMTTLESDTEMAMDDGPLIAIPLQSLYQHQIELLRLEQMISQAGRDPQRLAKLYYERGSVYDSVGLHALARLDFNRSLKVQPDFADSYNFIGVYLTLEQQYGLAYEAFDSALELAPELEYAYLNRSIALHYGNKPQLALADIKTFYQLDKSDPYRNIWFYLIQKEINPELALKQLTEQYKLHQNQNEWGWAIVAFLVKDIDKKQLFDLAADGDGTNQQLAERLCEAYFYLAEDKVKQDPDTAIYYLKLAIATNVYSYIEHRYALLELDLLLGNWEE